MHGPVWEAGRRAADHIHIVSVEHPGVDREGLAEEHAMLARMSELQRWVTAEHGS